MASTIQIKRGAAPGIPTLASGEPGWTTDTNVLYVGTGSGNILIGPATASGVSPLTTLGDIWIYGDSGDERLPRGSDYTVLISYGSATEGVYWGFVDLSLSTIGTLGPTKGGTGYGFTGGGEINAGDLLVGSYGGGGNSWTKLALGAEGYVLKSTSGTATWAAASSITATVSPLTTKGDIWGYSTQNARIPVGVDKDILTADSSQPLGVKWKSIGEISLPWAASLMMMGG